MPNDQALANLDMQTVYARRARFHTAENGFTFSWPPVPARQFLAERDRAFDPSTPSGAIPLDASETLGIAYVATTPVLLASYVKIRAGERLTTAFAGSGAIYYVMSGSGIVRAGSESAPVRSGDAVPIKVAEPRSFENTGSEPLELLVVGVAADASRKFEIVAAAGRM